MAEPISFKYRAFLSYSHADTAWARRLHRRLESFRIDQDLVGRATPHGAMPPTLRPIFRDREDFTAGDALADQTIAALDASAALIVLCSQASAKSHYVNEEVRLFRSRHPERPVIPVIVDGTPGDPARECFAPALRFDVAVDGTVTDTPTAALAADVRESGDGEDLAVAKIVARLLDLATDDVFRRAERARRRGARIRNGVIAALALLTVAAMGSAAYAWQQLKTNEAFLEATLRRATEIVDTAVAQAEKYNVPRTATLELLTRAEGLFDDMARLGRPTPALRRQKAWMLVQFARNYEILGDTAKQRERADEALRLMEALSADNPEDGAALRELAVTQNERGDAFVAQGNVRDALTSYQASLAIMRRLTAANPKNPTWQRDLSICHKRVGDMQVAQENLPEALESYQASLAIDLKLVQWSPDSGLAQRDLSVSYDRIGDILATQTKFEDALTSYRASLAIRARLAEAEPGNSGLQHDISVSHVKIGGVLADTGHLPEALEAQRTSLAIRERLAKAAPDNAGWQRDLAATHSAVGNLLAAQKEFTQALESYQAGLAIRERLATSNPANAGTQRDLAVSNSRVGDTFIALGNLPEALKSFQASHDVFERVARFDPDNAGSQRDLAVSDERLGGIHQALKENDEAKVAYEAALAIYTALLSKAPDNTAALIASTVSLMHLGELNGAAGRPYYVRALKTLKDLDETGRLEPRLKPAIGWIEQQLAALPASP